MSAGELRHYVAIEQLSYDGSSNTGDYSAEQSWSTLASVWARISYKSADETSTGRDATQQKAMIKMRWRSDVTTKHRINHGGVIFDIENAFDPTGKKQYLMIDSVVANGR